MKKAITAIAASILIGSVPYDAGALEHEFGRPVFAFIVRQVHDEHRAEDLRQEVFVDLLADAAGRSFPSVAEFKRYLFGIAQNEVRRHFRELQTSIPVLPLENMDRATDVVVNKFDPARMCEVVLESIREVYARALIEFHFENKKVSPDLLYHAREAARKLDYEKIRSA